MRTRFGSCLVMVLSTLGVPLDPSHAEERRGDRSSGHLEVEGASLYYERAGRGRPVVLLHAGVADSRMWDPQFAELARDFSVVRFDFRGFGRTRLAPGEFSDWGDVADVMDAVGFESAAIVGSSYGAQVAIDFTLAYPDRVDALVVSGPTVGGRPRSSELQEFGEAEEAALEDGDLDAAVELNLRTWVDGRRRNPSGVDRSVRSRVGTMQREVFEKEIPEGVAGRSLDPPAAGRLGEISAPTLVVVGEFDLASIVEQARWVAEQVPNASVATLPTAHMTNMEAPRAFNELVRTFLSRHDPPGSGPASPAGDGGFEELITDRPDFTESGVVVPRGSVQVEGGFTWERGADDVRTASGPELLVRWGLTRRMELRVGVPDYVGRRNHSNASGWGDGSIGTKLQLGPVAGWGLASIATLSLPTGEAGFGSDAWDPAVIVTTGRDLGRSGSLGGQVFAESVTDGPDREFAWGGTVVWSGSLGAGSATGTFLELAASVPERGVASVSIHHGYTRSITERLQLDVHGGAGLTESAPDFFVGAGMSFRR